MFPKGSFRRKALLPLLLGGALVFGAASISSAAPERSISLSLLGTYETGQFDAAAAEIVKYDPTTQRLFVVNPHAPGIDVLDVSDPSNPVAVAFIDASALGGGVNSVDIYRGFLAAAIEANVKTDDGVAAFYRTDTLELVGSVPAGALPDMITFTPNGRYALVANEGEPDGYEGGSTDPVGSITVVEIEPRFQGFSATQVGFEAFIGQEDALRAQGIRIFGPGANAAQDFEPEYITVRDDSRKAFVSLQENNAFAVLDLRQMAITDILPLGYKDHSLPSNELDASDDDDAINIASWPVRGLYMPDAITSYKVRGRTYIVSANEGDAREYDGFEEEERIKNLDLDATAFPNAADLQEDENIGRLTVTTTLGMNNANEYEALYSFGGRSFSIWDEYGNLVFDSGADFEQITAAAFPDDFNSTNDENGSFDTRSDAKGPEPEGIVLGVIKGRTYAFIGLERIGGVMVYDISDPMAPEFIQYLNNRDFGGDAEAGTAGDLGPEGLAFIPGNESPTGQPLLAVANEVSGSTSLYAITIDEERSDDRGGPRSSRGSRGR